MKITDVQIDGFGVWSDLSLDQLESDITVIYGPNEAGKTTLMQFIRSMLYGFSAERRSRYLPPVRGGNGGGSIHIENQQGHYLLQRTTKPHGDSWREQLKIRTDDGKQLEPGALSNVLAGVDESTFNNVFAVGLRELQELGTLNDTAAADHLYKLTSGMDRISLVDVVRLLNNLRTQLLRDDDGESRIDSLLQDQKRLRAKIGELSERANRWYEVRSQRGKLQEEVGKLETQIQERQTEARTVEIALRVRDAWISKARQENDLTIAVGSDHDKLAGMPEHALERLDELNATIERRRGQLRKLRRKRQKLRDEAREFKVDQTLLDHAPRIEALAEHGQWIASLEDQILRLRKDVDDFEEEIQLNYQSGDLPASIDQKTLTSITSKTFAALRGPARNLREQSARVKKLEEETELGQLQAMSVSQELETALAEQKAKDLPAAMEQAGELVSQLRRRVQLDERHERMEDQQKQLDQQVQEMVENQALPIQAYTTVGGFFIAGIILLATAWGFGSYLGLTATAIWGLSLLGFMSMLGAVWYKSYAERVNAEQLSDAQQQVEMLELQIDQLKSERDELDEETPAGKGSPEQRLEAAESTLQRLERLVPLDSTKKSAVHEQNAAQRRVEMGLESMERAQQRWREAVRGVGLPGDLEPQQVRRLSETFQHVADVRRRKQQRIEEMEQRERELFVLAGRIEQLLGEVNLRPESEQPREQLRQLSSALASAEQSNDRRQNLVGRDRQLKQRFRRLRKSYDNGRRQRQLWLGKAGATSEAEFRRLADRRKHVAKLETEIRTLNEQIQRTIGGHCATDTIGTRIANATEGQLDQQWDALSADLQTMQSRRNEMHQTHGELTHEMKMLASDRQLAEAQLDLSCVETQLAHSIERWQAVALTSRILEYVCDLYESERQPETLKEASLYLEQLTDGQYVRIWTPLDADVLNVDDRQGTVLGLDVLSRGTREAVFISLRMALVAALARRGAALPLVLDDVLVNFDNLRAKSAVRVFKAFAKAGHQLLLFTCHEHIMKLFKSSRVKVRTLPERPTLEPALEEDDWQEIETPAELEPAVEVVAESEAELEELEEPEVEVVAEDEEWEEEDHEEEVEEEEDGEAEGEWIEVEEEEEEEADEETPVMEEEEEEELEEEEEIEEEPEEEEEFELVEEEEEEELHEAELELAQGDEEDEEEELELKPDLEIPAEPPRVELPEPQDDTDYEWNESENESEESGQLEEAVQRSWLTWEVPDRWWDTPGKDGKAEEAA